MYLCAGGLRPLPVATALRAVPASSNYRVGLIAPTSSRRNQNDAFLPTCSRQKNCVGTAIYEFLSLSQNLWF